MPRITVLVDKDDRGKLWDYVFASEDKTAMALAQSNTQPILIHKNKERWEAVSQSVQKPSLESETISVGTLPLSNKMAVYRKGNKR